MKRLREGVSKSRGIQFTPPTCKRYAYRAKPARHTFYIPKISVNSVFDKEKLQEKDLTRNSKHFFPSQYYVDRISSFILFHVQYVFTLSIVYKRIEWYTIL